MWTMHNNFEGLVQNSWNEQVVVNVNIANCTRIFKERNVSVFGNLFHTKRKLLARLVGIQRKLHYFNNPFLVKLESGLLADYYRIIHEQEILWFQKSRV